MSISVCSNSENVMKELSGNWAGNIGNQNHSPHAPQFVLGNLDMDAITFPAVADLFFRAVPDSISIVTVESTGFTYI
jgi:hypothetical protein